jgi:hypothetical protein
MTHPRALNSHNTHSSITGVERRIERIEQSPEANHRPIRGVPPQPLASSADTPVVVVPTTLPLLAVLARVSLAVTLRAGDADGARRPNLAPAGVYEPNRMLIRGGTSRGDPERSSVPADLDMGIVRPAMTVIPLPQDIVSAGRAAVAHRRSRRNRGSDEWGAS